MATQVYTNSFILEGFRNWSDYSGGDLFLFVDSNKTDEPVLKANAQSTGIIVLNISNRAIGHIEIGQEYISLGIRFSGVPYSVVFPVAAVVGVRFDDDE